jgi:hypothetical protein
MNKLSPVFVIRAEHDAILPPRHPTVPVFPIAKGAMCGAPSLCWAPGAGRVGEPTGGYADGFAVVGKPIG